MDTQKTCDNENFIVFKCVILNCRPVHNYKADGRWIHKRLATVGHLLSLNV